MADLSDFKNGQIVGACRAVTIVTKTAELFGVARCAVSKIMTAFEKEGKTSSLKKNSWWKWKLSDSNHWTLMQIIWKDHKITALKIMAELNDHLENPVSPKTVRRELHKAGFHRRDAIRKPYKINLLEIFITLFNPCVHIYICIFLQAWIRVMSSSWCTVWWVLIPVWRISSVQPHWKVDTKLYYAIYILYWPIGIMVRVFANNLGDLGSIPGKSYHRLKKLYLMLPFLVLSFVRYRSRVRWAIQRK